MNYRIVFQTLGKILLVESVLLIIPLIFSVIYQENHLYIPFIITILLSLIIGSVLYFLNKKTNNNLFAREGLAIVSLSWIIISLIGCLPYIFSKEIPNFFDALFETVSGFSTTGATILTDVEKLSKSLLLWRAFTQWIGGMGILVFVLAILPNIDPRTIYILKAESTGPEVGKLVPKIKLSARILYGIYIFLTILLIILLWIGDMPFYDSIVHAIATAGTGGFSIKNQSISAYSSLYSEIIITVFMLIFSINFYLFYLILIGQGLRILKNEEFRWFIIIVLISISIITLNNVNTFNNFFISLKNSSFQVSSIMSTTGFSTYNFNTWPSLSKWVIVILMFFGGCAGATSGGMKISRIIILFKSVINEIKTSIRPHQVSTIRFNGKPVDNKIIKGISSFFIAYMFLLIFGTLIISIDNFDIITNFTSVLTCLSNVGPGLNIIGPTGNFSVFSNLSKLFLSLLMLTGRLEIFPILVLFTPKMWRKI